MGFANISIVGNLVRPPALQKFDTGNLVTTMQVAVNRIAKKGAEQQTEYYKVEAWNKLGELAAKYLDKGQQVTVVGRFSVDRWQDKEGRERFTLVVTANNISLPQKRSNGNREDFSDYTVLSSDNHEDIQESAAPAEKPFTPVVPTLAGSRAS